MNQTLTRRALLLAAAASGLAATTPAMSPALAKAAAGITLSGPVPFSFDSLVATARDMAKKPFAPAPLRRLPRPGPWMDVLRKGLAFPMYGAALWLAWVFAQQTGPIALGQLLAAGVLAAFGAWLYGLSQARRALGRSAPLTLGAGVLGIGLALGLAGAAAVAAKPSAPAAASAAAESPPTGPGLAAEVWSPEKLAALRAEGRPVLVDFTAAWCVTCQVNEKVALSGPQVAAAFKAQNAVYLKADWTNRDPVIAKALAGFGRVGVPLYVVYPKGDGAPVILPQLLTEGLVIEAIETAGR